MGHDELGDEQILATRLATARRLRALHQQQAFPEPDICGWCLKRWPCPDRRWAERVVRAAGAPADGAAPEKPDSAPD